MGLTCTSSTFDFAARPEIKGLPCFLFGESMGGAVALKVHLKQRTTWNGAVLVAPMCKVGLYLFLCCLYRI